MIQQMIGDWKDFNSVSNSYPQAIVNHNNILKFERRSDSEIVIVYVSGMVDTITGTKEEVDLSWKNIKNSILGGR